MEHTFSISDASKKLDVESHVLRYWEEELHLDIPRNEHGHRYYRETDINTFCYIKELKEKGLSLQDIRTKLASKSTLSLSPIEKDTKLDQFREIMNSIIGQAIAENNRMLSEQVSESTSERLIKEMNYLFRTFEENEDERLEQLKTVLNSALGAKREIATSKTKKHKKKRLFSIASEQQ